MHHLMHLSLASKPQRLGKRNALSGRLLSDPPKSPAGRTTPGPPSAPRCRTLRPPCSTPARTAPSASPNPSRQRGRETRAAQVCRLHRSPDRNPEHARVSDTSGSVCSDAVYDARLRCSPTNRDSRIAGNSCPMMVSRSDRLCAKGDFRLMGLFPIAVSVVKLR